MNASPARVIRMLIVEDNPADVVFLREALREAQIQAELHIASTGEEAMQFLLKRAPFDDAPRPDVVVLDLNVPVKSGREVLQEMMAYPALRTIPVAILTTSSLESHVCESYTSGRCLYFVKTDDLGRFEEIARRIAAHGGV